MINEISEQFIDLCIENLCKKENRKIINNKVLNPTIDFILEKIKPYILFTCTLFVFIIVLIISVIYLIILQYSTISN